MEKTIASKMIVENLFESKFGVGLNSFCYQNAKMENYKSNYSNVNELADILDDLMTKKKDSFVNFDSKNEIICSCNSSIKCQSSADGWMERV